MTHNLVHRLLSPGPLFFLSFVRRWVCVRTFVACSHVHHLKAARLTYSESSVKRKHFGCGPLSADVFLFFFLLKSFLKFIPRSRSLCGPLLFSLPFIILLHCDFHTSPPCDWRHDEDLLVILKQHNNLHTDNHLIENHSGLSPLTITIVYLVI